MKRLTLLLFGLLMLCAFRLPAYSASPLPEAENMEISMTRNTHCEGKLRADKNTVFFLTTSPRKGEIFLSADGKFVYTPPKDYCGRDYFGYRVKDAEGNISQEAAVVIRISR